MRTCPDLNEWKNKLEHKIGTDGERDLRNS